MPCLRAAAIASSASAAVVARRARRRSPPQWNQRAPSRPKIASQSTSPGCSSDAAEWPRSEQPSAARTPKPRSTKFSPLRAPRPTPSYGTQRRWVRSTPPWSIRSSISLPTGLSASAVTIAVRRPKQRRRPRATLYSPPPSETVNAPRRRDAAVAGIEPEHHLAERDEVVPALLRGADVHATAAAARARSSMPSSLRRDPGASAGEHGGKREILAEVLDGDPAGGNELHVREDGADGLDERRAADERRREDLDDVAAERPRAVRSPSASPRRG